MYCKYIMICSICTEFCTDGAITSCGHKFHMNCLMNWIEINNNCPNCRLINPIKKDYILQAHVCGCGSCTAIFLPNEINIWICNKIPLCPHCFVDC